MTQNAMGRRAFVRGAAMSPLAMAASKASGFAKGGTTKRPNILYILADDLGYADLHSFGGHGAHTPVLDHLVSEGLRMPNAYANSSVCSPSRLALITGRYPGRMRVGLEEPIAPLYEDIGLEPGLPTLPELFHRAGYTTALIGKWHLGPLPKYGPLKSGYDRFYGFYEGAADYFRNDATALTYEMGQLHDGTDPLERIGYLTDQLGDRTIDELKLVGKGSQPFFISLHFNAPHWPWEGPKDKKHSQELVDLMDTEGGSPETYAEMVRAMDENIGRVLHELRRQGLDENTIVIFASDNGGERFSDTWPLIGLKGELLEGGIRVPLVMRWPGQLAAGKVCEQVISLFDLYPTLLAAAGLKPDASFMPDGLNMLDILRGDAPIIPRKLYWRHKKFDQAAIRDGDWKYVRLNGNEHLFNIAEDERERAEKKRLEPEILERLRADWDQWNAQMLPYPPESFSTAVAGRAERY